jgi:hypothetical protein
MIEVEKAEITPVVAAHTKAQKRLIPIIGGILLLLGIVTVTVYLTKNKKTDNDSKKSPAPAVTASLKAVNKPAKIDINKPLSVGAEVTRKANSYVRGYPSKTELKDEELVVVEVEATSTAVTGGPAGSLDYKLVVDDATVLNAEVKPEDSIDASMYGYQPLTTVFLNKEASPMKGVVVFKIPKSAKKLTLRHVQLSTVNAKNQTINPAKNFDLPL